MSTNSALNNDEIQQSKPIPSKKSQFYEWVKVIIIALLIALPIRYFIAEPFIVSGASMDPTFSTGNFLIVDRLTYRFSKPQRGDVVIFKYPNNPDKYFIKRIIGLPNEKIQINKGVVTITSSSSPANGITLAEPYIDSKHATSESMNFSTGSTEYFVMGDNRLQSMDSRSWGPLDEIFITGRALVRLFPFNKIDSLPGSFNNYVK